MTGTPYGSAAPLAMRDTASFSTHTSTPAVETQRIATVAVEKDLHLLFHERLGAAVLPDGQHVPGPVLHRIPWHVTARRALESSSDSFLYWRVSFGISAATS